MKSTIICNLFIFIKKILFMHMTKKKKKKTHGQYILD